MIMPGDKVRNAHIFLQHAKDLLADGRPAWHVCAAIEMAMDHLHEDMRERGITAHIPDPRPDCVFWYEAALPTRTINNLRDDSETRNASPRQIAELGERRLMRITGFGKISLEAVRSALSEQFGYKLSP